MTGCEFLEIKGNELNWNHDQLFTYFKSQIEPFMSNLKDTCLDMLKFFNSMQNFNNIQLTEEIESKYETFIDIYHYQQFVEINEEIIPPMEVQLFWIVHCLNPVEYLNDCYSKYRKLLNVTVYLTDDDDDEYDEYKRDRRPELEEFDNYLNKRLTANILKRISITKSITTNRTSTSDVTTKTWFIRNLHMKNSILQYLQFINKMNYIQSNESQQLTIRKIYKCIHRYYKFLYLMALPPNRRPPICIATIDIELVWNAHILNFDQYYAMSKQLFPNIDIIPHNHLLSSVQQKQNKVKTKIFWDQIFGKNDYLNGRAFFINTITTKKKKRKKKKRKMPKAPIALQVPPSQSPATPQSPQSSPQSPDTIGSSNMLTPIPTSYSKYPGLGNNKTVDKEIEMMPNTKNQTKHQKNQHLEQHEKKQQSVDCFDVSAELCTDCCLWAFRTHRNENIYMIIGISLCVLLLITLLGIFVFASNDDIVDIPIIDQDDIFPDIDMYQTNVILNQDLTLSINSLLTFKFDSEVLDQKNRFHFEKLLAYKINENMNEDILAFQSNDLISIMTDIDVDDYYHINVTIDLIESDTYSIEYNYTLSSQYLCCTNNECNKSFGFLLPWINRWKYSSMIDEFEFSFVGLSDINNISTTWSTKQKNGYKYNFSRNDIEIDKDLYLYFTSNTMNRSKLLNQCNQQKEYFIDYHVEDSNDDNNNISDDDEKYKQRMKIWEFLLLSCSTILFMICVCYGCWWTMFLLDNTFCCDFM